MPTLPESVMVPAFVGSGRIETTNRTVPTPGPGQLLLQVRANALCGSERGQFYNGTSVVPGHEAAGVVVAVGENTTTAIGTPGVVFLMDFCGECRSCKLGYTNQCLQKRADMGFNRDGGYGVYEMVSENIFFPVPESLSLTEATLLLDVMGTGGHAVKRAQQVRPDIESVLITGAGPIGLGLLVMAKLLLGKDVPVLLSDPMPYRLELAEKLGGLPILLTERTLAEGLNYHGIPRPDVAIDAAGRKTVREECIGLLAPRGVWVGVAHGEGLCLESVSREFIPRELTLTASEYFAFHELHENLPLLLENREYLAPILTHRFGVGDIQHAFELFFKGETGKVIIEQ